MCLAEAGEEHAEQYEDIYSNRKAVEEIKNLRGLIFLSFFVP